MTLRKVKTSVICLAFIVLGSWGCTSKKELGNVMRIAIREKFKSLDPAQGQDYYSNIAIRRAYEGLLQYHYLKRPYALEPLLAESMPTISKDALTYTFKIKKGVLFQSDAAFEKNTKRELVAGDFVYSFKRLADPAVASSGWWTLDEKIVGLNAWREQASRTGKADYSASVEGLKALDPYTLQIKLTKKSSVFLHALTMSYASAVAHEVVEYYKADFGNHPVGTGPFQLQNFSMNQLIWVKNPTYHTQFYPNEGTAEDQKAGRLADAGKSIPFLDKIVDDIIIEDQPAWLNFIRGDHDYLLKIPKDNQASIFDANQKPVKEIQDRGITLFTEPGIWFNYIAMNMEDPVLGGEENKFLRKAMSMAFDEAPAIEKFYLGLAQRAESMIPPGIFGYDPQYKNPSREYNLVKAKEILAKAGHANGEGIPELVFDLKSDLAQRQLAEYFQRSMAELGIRVKLNVVSWPELLSRLRKKQAQIWLMSWLYDYPDVENGLQLLYSKNESPGSNEANYKNPKYDALYEKFIVSESESEKKVLIAKMRDFLAEDVPWILTLHQTETRLTNPWTKNFKIHAFEHNVEKYLRIDQDERKKMLSR